MLVGAKHNRARNSGFDYKENVADIRMLRERRREAQAARDKMMQQRAANYHALMDSSDLDDDGMYACLLLHERSASIPSSSQYLNALPNLSPLNSTLMFSLCLVLGRWGA